jgi:Protein of unknown function (DUF2934)
MNKPQPVRLNSGDPDLLNRIEKLRGRLLYDQGIRSRISQRAYELYEQRGGDPGRDVEDWLLAENEILSPLIEAEIRRAAREDGTQSTKKPARTSNAPQSSTIKRRSAKAKENSLTTLKNPKSQADRKGKGRKKKMDEPTPLDSGETSGRPTGHEE